MSARVLAIGDRIEKTGGDYRFAGEVVSVFKKRNGVVRYVVENDDGVLHIFSAANLQQTPNESTVEWSHGVFVSRADYALLENDRRHNGTAYVERTGSHGRRIDPVNLLARVYAFDDKGEDISK